MTSLRTMWGIDLQVIKNKFSRNYSSHFSKEAEKYFAQKLLKNEGEKIFLTDKGKLFADKIASDLFVVFNK